MMSRQTDVERIADQALQIYKEKFQEDYESQHNGKFVAIDIRGEKAYLGDFAEDALREGRKRSPYGIFHLIRVGSSSAFRLRHPSREIQISYW